MSSSNNTTPLYNLSNIPGFDDLLKTDQNNLNILKLNKFECKTNNSVYKIIRYDKNILNLDIIPLHGLCRSVIVNSKNKVVCFAPPKSQHPDRFMKNYPVIKDEIRAEEFIEGTMINVFFDDTIGVSGSWEIATRNNVGANNIFFKTTDTKSFRDMFMEATKECALDINLLDKTLCYSFVLQHPNNRIVLPFKRPQLYLVAVYNIMNGDDNISVYIKDVRTYIDFFRVIGSKVKIPEVYYEDNYTDLINKYCSMNTSYDIQGVVVYNVNTGERTKIRNPVYEEVKHLRGNQPKLEYQYLCLRKEGKVKEYLKYYKEHSKDFSQFRHKVHLFTSNLCNNYVYCYIQKSKPLIEFPAQYRTHMFKLHEYYLNELREKKLFITYKIVQNYVNNLHPSLLMYCLNYNMRKHNIDTLIADK